MKPSITVLHLSVMLAMTLTSANGAVYARDDSIVSSETETRQQLQFQNPEENVQLRHRVGEAEMEQAQRNRLELRNESQATEAENGDQANSTMPSHDRDRTWDRDNIHSDDPTFESIKKRQRLNQSTEELTKTEEAFESRFGYKDRTSGQSFNTSGSIYSNNSNSRSGNTGMGGNSKVTNRSAGQGSGGGNGRR